jgi:DNA-binding MarR family transcriptional regulator
MASSNPFLWWLPGGGGDKAARTGGRVPPSASLPEAASLIRRAQQISVAVFLDEWAELDLTPVQFAALEVIGAQPGIDATRLCGLTGFDRTTISGVLERMQAKGWISRKAGAEDKRTKTVSLTAAGKKLLARAEPMAVTAQEKLLAPLDDDEKNALVGLLEKLVEGNNDLSRAPRRSAGD